MSTVKAKMKVQSVVATEYGETLKMSAVGRAGDYPEDGTDENNTYAKFTPTAELTMQINNPALAGKFVRGAEYYLDFTEACKEEGKAAGGVLDSDAARKILVEPAPNPNGAAVIENRYPEAPTEELDKLVHDPKTVVHYEYADKELPELEETPTEVLKDLKDIQVG